MTQHKDLGVNFSNNLHWSKHYEIIIAKVYQMLGFLRRTFKLNSTEARKQLYISLVWSQLLYCSPLWRPQLLQDIFSLERVQCRATKFILNDYDSSYKTRLEKLHLLPLMYLYELNDLMFLVKSLKTPTDFFNIYHYVHFASNATRSGTSLKLVHNKPLSSIHQHFFFIRIVRFWNHLPTIDLSLHTNQINKQLKSFFWNHFINKFNPDLLCTYHVICPCHRCTSLLIPVNFDNLDSYIPQ